MSKDERNNDNLMLALVFIFVVSPIAGILVNMMESSWIGYIIGSIIVIAIGLKLGDKM